MTGDGRGGATTPAQERVLEEVLGWGRPRPAVPPELLMRLRAQLEAAVVGQRPDPVPATLHLAAVLRGGAARSRPWRHDRDTVRGILLGRVFARDVERGHTVPPDTVVAEVAAELAAERPGDPASASAWLNAAGAAGRGELQREVVGVLSDVRTLWPALDRDRLVVQVRPTLRVEVAPGPTVITFQPDLVLDSPRTDERARSLVIVTRTGMPRPREDRDRARATALMTALATRRVPFRWVVLHLTDGRAEVEELDAGVLSDTARWVGERVASLTGGGSTDTSARSEGQR